MATLEERCKEWQRVNHTKNDPLQHKMKYRVHVVFDIEETVCSEDTDIQAQSHMVDLYGDLIADYFTNATVVSVNVSIVEPSEYKYDKNRLR